MRNTLIITTEKFTKAPGNSWPPKNAVYLSLSGNPAASYARYDSDKCALHLYDLIEVPGDAFADMAQTARLNVIIR
jgi:hypothetical protein